MRHQSPFGRLPVGPSGENGAERSGGREGAAPGCGAANSTDKANDARPRSTGRLTGKDRSDQRERGPQAADTQPDSTGPVARSDRGGRWPPLLAFYHHRQEPETLSTKTPACDTHYSGDGLSQAARILDAIERACSHISPAS
jgi:hypothetical protein